MGVLPAERIAVSDPFEPDAGQNTVNLADHEQIPQALAGALTNGTDMYPGRNSHTSPYSRSPTQTKNRIQLTSLRPKHMMMLINNELHIQHQP